MELNSSKWTWLSDKIYQLVYLLDLVVTLSSQESGCSDSACQMRLTFPLEGKFQEHEVLVFSHWCVYKC